MSDNKNNKVKKKKVKNKILVIIIDVFIIAAIALTIIFFSYIARTLWTLIAIICLAAPFVHALLDHKKPIGSMKTISLFGFGFMLFILGVWGHINLAEFIKPIISPIGYTEIAKTISSFGCADGECYDLIYTASGILGDFKLDNFTITFVLIITYTIYGIVFQPICYFVQNVIMKIDLLDSIKNKIVKVLINISTYTFIFLLLFFVITKESYPRDIIINSLNQFLYPGYAVSLVEATKRSKIDLVLEILKKGGDINAKDSNGESALLTAQLIENTRLMEIYSSVLRNEDPEKYDLLEMGIMYTKESFLEQVEKGNFDAVELFVKSGIPLNPNNDDYYYLPIGDAVINGYIDIVELLIEYGADINIREQFSDERPMLCIAADNESYEMVVLLVESGADVNAVDNDNFSALMYASMHGNIDITAFLIRNNADLNIKSYAGNSAILLAAKNLNNSNLKDEENPYYQVIRCFGESEKYIDYNIQNNEGWTCLMYASKYGNVPLVKYLLLKGAEPNAYLYQPDNEGNTALRMAKYYGYTEITELLTEAGAVD